MIQKHHSLITAEIILSFVMNSHKGNDIDCSVDCYQNGREQGFLLWGFTKDNECKGIYIAEERRSDSIIVYIGDYAMQSISEDAYKNPTFFRQRVM